MENSVIAERLTFIKNAEGGALVAYALVGWDGDDFVDCLVAG